jgi:GDPmannose 4,6-dehydratase
MTKRALITGITGQDGSYLAELLLAKGYEVFGLTRRVSTPSYSRIAHLIDKVTLIDGDLCDSNSLVSALKKARPDEVYNLGAQSFVQLSFTEAIITSEVTGLGVTRMLEAVKEVAPEARFYQAGSSEMFGNSSAPPQNEDTKFTPRSPYGCAKLYGHAITLNYRERGMFACNGILFNHESPRRGREFVTQKIALAAAAIKKGKQDKLFLGNLDAYRDWGHAKDYVEAMWLMLQQQKPDDYVVATGEAHSVREFCELSFGRLGMDYKNYVEIDPKFFRPAEVNYLRGDAAKARAALGWEPKISFQQLVEEMVDHAMEIV